MKKIILLVVIIALLIIGCSISKSLHISSIQTNVNFNVLTIKKGEMMFGVSNKKPENTDFYINSNFFTKTNNPIGLVVIDRLRYSDRKTGGGYFYVVNGIPHISAKYCPKMTEYASQSILWVIDDGVENKILYDSKHGNKNVYRTVMGQNKDGDIIVVSSSRLGFVTIKDIVSYSKSIGMVEGILLDGGTSVDYKFSDDSNEIEFQSIPDIVKSSMAIDQPTTYIYGNFRSN
jgi:hypothetical protein